MHVQDHCHQLHQALQHQIRSAPHLRHVAPHRSFFIGMWETRMPDPQPFAGACSAQPRACEFLHSASGRPNGESRPCCPQVEFDSCSKNGAGSDTRAPAPPGNLPVHTPEGGDAVRVLAHACAGARSFPNGTRGASQHAPVQLPLHGVVEVKLQRLQVPPQLLLQSGWRPRLEQALQVARSAADGANLLACCDLLSGIWCACTSTSPPHQPAPHSRSPSLLPSPRFCTCL